jgi:hypothetical protein
VEDQDGAEHSELADVSRDDVQHFLERRFFLLGVTKRGLDLTFAGLLTDDYDKEESLARGDIRTGQKNARRDVVMVLFLALGTLLMDSLLFHARCESITWQVVRFTGHRRFVDLNATGFENNSVNGNAHTGFNLDDITDREFVLVLIAPSSVAKNVNIQ